MAYTSIFCVTIKKLGYNFKDLNVTIQHNLHSLRTKKELNHLLYFLTNQESNNWNISISNSFENSIEKELSNLLFESYQNLTTSNTENSKVNNLASKISFNWNIEKSFTLETAKLRAARFLWSKLTTLLPDSLKNSKALNIHITNNKYLTAITGGAQSLISNEKDANFIKKNTFISKTVDPWAGSKTIEEHTKNIINNSWDLFIKLQNSEAKLFEYSNCSNIVELTIKEAEKKATLEEINEIIEQ